MTRACASTVVRSQPATYKSCVSIPPSEFTGKECGRLGIRQVTQWRLLAFISVGWTVIIVITINRLRSQAGTARQEVHRRTAEEICGCNERGYEVNSLAEDPFIWELMRMRRWRRWQGYMEADDWLCWGDEESSQKDIFRFAPHLVFTTTLSRSL